MRLFSFPKPVVLSNHWREDRQTNDLLEASASPDRRQIASNAINDMLKSMSGRIIKEGNNSGRGRNGLFEVFTPAHCHREGEYLVAGRLFDGRVVAVILAVKSDIVLVETAYEPYPEKLAKWEAGLALSPVS